MRGTMRDESELDEETISWRVPRGRPRSFEVGDVIAGRYEIVRFLARGSGGEIYEVQDRELRLRVALKTVNPEAAGDRRAQGRFRREILLARQVSHPNVCRIYDLGLHRPEDGGREVMFLTMELLEGRTLADRIEEGGAIDPEEALPLVRQMAGALAAAHGVGVVHRDFKSSNVLLVEAAEGEARAIVADFGLARNLEVEGADGTSTVLTREGTVIGTPAYMAPEQVMGEKATPAVDLYALGVVIYEMVTGRLPFTGSKPIEVATRRLSEDPPRPSLWAPDLDAVWEETILRCLARDPDDRFASPLEVVAALEGSEPAPSPRRRRQQRRRWLTAAAAVVIAILLSVGAWWGSRIVDSTPEEEAAVSAAPPRLALLGVRDLQGHEGDAWIGETLEELLTHELAPEEGFGWVRGDEVERVLVALELDLGQSLAPSTREALGEMLGADAFLYGSYLALGEEGGRRLSLFFRLQRIEGEAILWSERGGEDDLPELARDAAERVRRELGPNPAP